MCISGTGIDARVRSKGCDHQRPGAARGNAEYILYDANAGYQQTLLPVVIWPAKKIGLRSHGHHQHHRSCWSGPLERHETPDPVRSGAVKARFQCVRVRAQARAHSRVCPGQLALAPVSSVRPCVRSRVDSCVRSSVRARPGRTPSSDQARDPRQQRSLGSERGLATPSPDGKGEIPLGPSMKIMPVDSYSTLGRSCEPAFKWIPDPGRAGSGRGPHGSVRRSLVAGPRWAAAR